MKLKRCSKGHYYDGDRNRVCPFCGEQSADGDASEASAVRQAADSAVQDPMTTAAWMNDDPVTIKSSYIGGEPQETAGAAEGALTDEGTTVSYYSVKMGPMIKAEPVTGWLVCTKGEYFGQGFPLKSGRNFIGRSKEADISLELEPTVSRRRHGVIVYEPRGRNFIAQAGDSKQLFYVNGTVVLEPVALKPYDVIAVGRAEFRLVPFCCRQFAWEDLSNDGDAQKKQGTYEENGQKKPDQAD